MKEIQLGPLSISLPNQTSAVFTIFENLADFFDTEYQSEAVNLLNNELKKTALKPKPNIDYESDYTHIDSRSADTIFAVAKIINELCVQEKHQKISESEFNEIYNQLKNHKRPPRQKWKIGDVFSVPLLENNFSFGQVVGTHITKTSPTCILIDLLKKDQNVSIEELQNAKIITIQNLDAEYLSNHTFKIITNINILVDPLKAKKGHSTSDNILILLANAYYGFEPWNTLGDEKYYDKILFEGMERPKNIIWLNGTERNKYRRENFKIDENNNFIK